MPLIDQYGRDIHDLRISITDRCNYRCVYCRTGTHGPEYAELTLADYVEMARVFVSLGIRKIRLTGGEPLLRRDVVEMVRQLKQLRTAEGNAPEVAITTNGHLLAELAAPLKAAGLDRVTVSMDAVEPERFARITRVANGFTAVLAGVRAARAAGLMPVKINCVLLRGFNEDQVEDFGRFAQQERVVVRFIEFMPLEEGRVWSPQVVVPLAEVLERMSRLAPFHTVPYEPNSTSRRYRFDDGSAEFGVIAPVSLPFCGACSRIRLTSDGKIRTCLFSLNEHDLRAAMAGGEEEMRRLIEYAVAHKEERHHIGEPGFVQPGRSMVHIGG